MMYYMYNNS